MYAVIKTGGKQYKAATGDVLIVEKIEAEAGTELEFNHILMVVDGSKVTVGSPLVAGAKTTGISSSGSVMKALPALPRDRRSSPLQRKP